MKRITTTILFSAMACGTLFAQPIVENLSSSSAVVVRDPARQSSTEVDAAIYNPAGTAFAKEGLSFSVSGIANFGQIKANDGTKSYKIRENYVMPSVQLAFKKDKWAFSGSFASEGGYRRNYKDESPILDGIVGLFNEYLPNSNVSNGLQSAGLVAELHEILYETPDIGMDADDELRLSQYSAKSRLYNWTIRLGAAYEILPNLSAYVGMRLNRVSWKAQPKYGMEVYNPSSETSTPFAEYSKNASENIENYLDESYQETKEYLLERLDAYETVSNLLTNASSYATSHTESGWGIAPVIGLDYKGKAFNVGMKYEFGSHINIGDGEDFTLPAIMSLGGNWQALRWLNIAVGGDLYFKSAGNPFCAFDDELYWDASVSATFTCSKSLKANIGWQIGKQFAWEEDFSYRNVSSINIKININKYAFPHKFSAGIRYAFTDKISVDLGVAIMSPLTVNSTANNNLTVEGRNVEGYEELLPDYTGSSQKTVTYKKRTPVQVALGFNYGL